MSFEFVTTQRRDNVLLVTLNRPEVYNAIHPPMHLELAQVWDDFSQDRELWVAVLTGAGEKAFCAGNDLKFTATGGRSSLPPSGFSGLTQRFDLEKPIIAAVNGFAMGGGFETALSCDMIIASKNATFALPEVKVGFLAAASGIQRLSRYIGRLAAQEMMFTGRSVKADEALEIGIVNNIVPQDQLIECALALAQEIASVSPSAVKATKRVLNDMALKENLPQSLDFSREVVEDLAKTEDFKEGVNAFVEKRKPTWVNR
jgi:enoyl-CoA hydratase/carnithine racemase